VGSWLDVMRRKTGYDFELPTEAQWEFAGRAGVYLLELYTGEANMNHVSAALENSVRKIAWYNGNAGKTGDKYNWHPVGSLKPNAFGLYDMLGGGAERMLNTFYPYDTEGIMYEPEGGDAAAEPMCRSYTLANGYAANSRICVRLRESALKNNGYLCYRVILPDTEGLVYPAWDKK
jgi:formylglycine-generating enzyme required for sulfatase activity